MAITHENADWKEYIDGLKKLGLKELAIKQKSLKQQKEDLSAMEKVLNKEYDAIRLMAIPELMEEADINTVTYDGIGRVTLTGDMYVSVPADNRDGVQDWLNDSGHGDLIKSTVNASTLKAFVKEQIGLGKEVTDLIKYQPFTRASITKIAAKKLK